MNSFTLPLCKWHKSEHDSYLTVIVWWSIHYFMSSIVMEVFSNFCQSLTNLGSSKSSEGYYVNYQTFLLMFIFIANGGNQHHDNLMQMNLRRHMVEDRYAEWPLTHQYWWWLDSVGNISGYFCDIWQIKHVCWPSYQQITVFTSETHILIGGSGAICIYIKLSQNTVW